MMLQNNCELNEEFKDAKKRKRKEKLKNTGITFFLIIINKMMKFKYPKSNMNEGKRPPR